MDRSENSPYPLRHLCPKEHISRGGYSRGDIDLSIALDWDSKLRLPLATMPGRKQQRTFAYNDLHRRAPPALERVLLAMVTTSKKGGSSFSVNYNMTGETNLPTGIIDFLGIKKFIKPNLGPISGTSRKALIYWPQPQRLSGPGAVRPY